MTMRELDPDYARAVVCGVILQIECPTCNHCQDDPCELPEDCGGTHWTLDTEDRYRECEACGQLLDCGLSAEIKEDW